MLLLSSPRWGRVGRALLLLLLAVALLHVTSASPQAGCPSHIDCAKAGRHFCKADSSQCGPCLYPLKENEEGRCVIRKRHRPKTKVYPDLDEEIDFLHSVIEKEQVSEAKPGRKQSNYAAISFQSDLKTTQPHAPAPKEEIQNVQTTTTAPSSTTTDQSTTKPPQPLVTGVGGRAGPVVSPTDKNDKIIVIMISVCVIAGTAAVILATVCAVKLQRDSRLTQKVDYPAFGGATVAPVKVNGHPTTMGDQTLAQNAQMFHYHHQKQQMLSMGKQKPEQKVDTDVTSDEEEVGGDFTVYECPGLAPTGEMEVKNPLFDDSTLQYQGNPN